jgi:uncharacterized membrane protein
MLLPPFKPEPGWAEALAGSLRNPKFSISIWEALGRRLRRNYLAIYLILAGAWALKSLIHPTPAGDWTEFVNRSALGPVPGWVMLIIGLAFNGGLVLFALLTTRLRNSSGEVGAGAFFQGPVD